MTVTIDDVKEALRDVQDPDLKKPLLELNMIDDIKVESEGEVSLTVYLTTPACPLKEQICNDVESALRTLPEVKTVSIKMDHRVVGEESKEIARGVRNFVAVASGKGGVGKSTTAVNLAMALLDSGAKVGLLDADITGPSIPHMLGAKDWQPQIKDNVIEPLTTDKGLKVMSIGFFVGDGEAVVWRGPMLHKALRQLLDQVQWGEIDYLIIDLPPGTGDVQLSLVQLIPLTGAVVVSTPQDVALLDVRKCLTMFKNTNIKVFGMIENMSVFVCPHCGESSHIFGQGGVAAQAQELNLNFLGSIPLKPEIRLGADSGSPVFLTDQEIAQEYRTLAKQLAAQISIFRLSGEKPKKLEVHR